LDLSNRPHALLLRIELHTVNYTADNEQETNPAQIMSEPRCRSFRQAVQLKQVGQPTAAISERSYFLQRAPPTANIFKKPHIGTTTLNVTKIWPPLQPKPFRSSNPILHSHQGAWASVWRPGLGVGLRWINTFAIAVLPGGVLLLWNRPWTQWSPPEWGICRQRSSEQFRKWAEPHLEVSHRDVPSWNRCSERFGKTKSIRICS